MTGYLKCWYDRLPLAKKIAYPNIAVTFFFSLILIAGSIRFVQVHMEEGLEQRIHEYQKGQVHRISNALERLRENLKEVARQPRMISAFHDLDSAFSHPDSGGSLALAQGFTNRSWRGVITPYRRMHGQHDTWIEKHITDLGVQDIYLVNDNGDVVYAQSKDGVFASNLISGPGSNSALAHLFQDMRDGVKPNRVVMTDVSAFAPQNGTPSFFAAVSLVDGNGKRVGYMIARINAFILSSLVNTGREIGSTGQSYLLGRDSLLRTRVTGQPTWGALKKYFPSRPYASSLKGNSGLTRHSGTDGSRMVTGFTPIMTDDIHWILITEAAASEAFAAGRTGRVVFIFAALLMLLSCAFLAMRRIGQDIAKQLTKGPDAPDHVKDIERIECQIKTLRIDLARLLQKKERNQHLSRQA